MDIKSIAVLGCGNMGSAFSLGLSAASTELKFYTYTPTSSRARDLARKLGGSHFEGVQDMPEVDMIILACKPQNISDLLNNFGTKLTKTKYIMSLLAGVTTSYLEKSIPGPKVIRVMPNTPATVGEGLNLVYGPSLLPKERESLLNMLSDFSKNLYLNSEDDFDYLTGVSGSGPAYIFELIRILSLPFQAKGVNKDLSEEFAAHIIKGAATLFEKSTDDVVELRKNVTSTGGVTAQALKVFTENNVEKIYFDAINAAYEKAKELSQ